MNDLHKMHFHSIDQTNNKKNISEKIGKIKIEFQFAPREYRLHFINSFIKILIFCMIFLYHTTPDFPLHY